MPEPGWPRGDRRRHLGSGREKGTFPTVQREMLISRSPPGQSEGCSPQLSLDNCIVNRVQVTQPGEVVTGRGARLPLRWRAAGSQGGPATHTHEAWPAHLTQGQLDAGAWWPCCCPLALSGQVRGHSVCRCSARVVGVRVSLPQGWKEPGFSLGTLAQFPGTHRKPVSIFLPPHTGSRVLVPMAPSRPCSKVPEVKGMAPMSLPTSRALRPQLPGSGAPAPPCSAARPRAGSPGCRGVGLEGEAQGCCQGQTAALP